MDSIGIRWKKPLPSKIELSNKKTHSQKQQARKIPPPKQQKITQNIKPHVPRTIPLDSSFADYPSHTPFTIVNLSRQPTYSSSEVIPIHDDRKLCSVRAVVVTFIIIAIIIIAAGASVGIVFAAIKTQNSNGTGSGSNSQNSLSTISTGLITSTISIGSQTGVPCSGYTQIDDPTRNYNYTGSYSSCDNGQLFNESNGGSWIRFVGSGGTTIPLTSPGLFHCGSFLSSWYNNTLPTTPNVITTGTICFETYAGICGYTVDISVVYCSAGYYVYFLPPIGICNARYCTN